MTETPVKTGVFCYSDLRLIFFGNVWQRSAKEVNLSRIFPDKCQSLLKQKNSLSWLKNFKTAHN
jgi:hypothetical protein